jgi:recombination protein RecR
MDLPSKWLERAVEEVAQLPGIGKRTALRLVLHLLKRPGAQTQQLAQALTDLRSHIKYCSQCHNISDQDICGLCTSSKRDRSLVMVVEDVRDVMAIEATGQYGGLYHVLGGAISPIEGIGPDNLRIKELVARLADPDIKEVIIATDPNLEGEATATYLTRMLAPMGITISRLASGLPVGGDLEYADEITLGRAFEGRRTVS